MTDPASVPPEILAWNATQDDMGRPICDRLAAECCAGLPEAEARLWHAHPVWFLDGNPAVGYSRLKSCVRLLFWSGQSFAEPGLRPEGSFKAAETLLRSTPPPWSAGSARRARSSGTTPTSAAIAGLSR